MRRWKFEHRYVWERARGQIPRGYEVHHRNEDKLDNRIENLQLMRKRDHLVMHKLKYHTREERLRAEAMQARSYRARRRTERQ